MRDMAEEESRWGDRDVWAAWDNAKQAENIWTEQWIQAFGRIDAQWIWELREWRLEEEGKAADREEKERRRNVRAERMGEEGQLAEDRGEGGKDDGVEGDGGGGEQVSGKGGGAEEGSGGMGVAGAMGERGGRRRR